MQMRTEKSAIHQACIQRQEELIHNFQSKVEDLKKELFAHDSIPSQEDHNPAERIEILDSMEKELNFLHFEMNILRNLNPNEVSEDVQPGAVVVTDKRTFYICVSIEEIEVEGKNVFGISTQAPLYQVMMHKKKGDNFSFNNTQYIIEDLY